MSEEHLNQTRRYEGLHLPPIPLGTVIAERSIVLHEADGRERQITVRLGSPVPIPAEAGLPASSHRCPTQILGIGIDDTVIASPGIDAFDAVYNALDLIGQQLEHRTRELNLNNRFKVSEVRRLSWIWSHPPE
jgi:hypothetical protein